MAAADNYELTIDQARDWEWSIRWKVGKTERTAVPKPGIVDYDFFLGFKENFDDPTTLLLLSSSGGSGVTADGWIRFQMTHTQAETLPAKRLKYEVVAISPENKKYAIAKGTAIVVPKVV